MTGGANGLAEENFSPGMSCSLDILVVCVSRPLPVAGPAEMDRQAGGFDHRVLACNTLTGDVKRRPVVDRRPDNWQSEADVDSLIKAKHLDGNVPLVVVHRHDTIELAPGGTRKDRVRGPRS